MATIITNKRENLKSFENKKPKYWISSIYAFMIGILAPLKSKLLLHQLAHKKESNISHGSITNDTPLQMNPRPKCIPEEYQYGN